MNISYQKRYLFDDRKRTQTQSSNPDAMVSFQALANEHWKRNASTLLFTHLAKRADSAQFEIAALSYKAAFNEKSDQPWPGTRVEGKPHRYSLNFTASTFRSCNFANYIGGLAQNSRVDQCTQTNWHKTNVNLQVSELGANMFLEN
jgi:hypothetical protein